MPALMTILGRRFEAFSFTYPRFVLAPWNALADRGGGWVIRNAIGAGAVATAALGVLALPLTGLQTGPVSPALLPSHDPARVSYEKIAAVMGSGFATPFNIVVASDRTPITDRAMLRKLDAFQAQIAADKRVASVVGPGDLYATAAELKKVPKQLNSSKKMRKSVPKVPLVPDPPRHAEGQREEGVRPIAHRGGHVAGRPRRLQGEDLGHVQGGSGSAACTSS